MFLATNIGAICGPTPRTYMMGVSRPGTFWMLTHRQAGNCMDASRRTKADPWLRLPHRANATGAPRRSAPDDSSESLLVRFPGSQKRDLDWIAIGEPRLFRIRKWRCGWRAPLQPRRSAI